VFGKQTLKQLETRYKKSYKTIRKYFDRHNPVLGEIIPFSEPINLVMDATFFNRSDGVLICRAEKRNLHWRHINGEKIIYYREVLGDLITVGFKFKSFTIDGRRGVRELLLQMFPGVPIQLCHFHQTQTITRYLSKKPKLEAGKELRRLALTLKNATEKRFERELRSWYLKWCSFLRERTVNQETGRWCYTHDRVRSSYFSLRRNAPYLFAYKKYPKLKIPNTTNSCDGSFTHWKKKLALHGGLAKHRRRKMLNYLLENCTT